MDRFDLTVIGGGPVGLFAAALAGMHGMKTKLIEALPYLGGQLTALYPEKWIYDVAGFPRVLAKDLVEHLEQQARRYHPAIVLEETVDRLEALPDGGYRLYTDRAAHETRAILITSGIGAFAPRKLPVAGAERFEGRGLYYFVPPMQHFADQTVVVVGGGDSALDWALAASEVAKSVLLVHRRDEFRGQAETLRQVMARPNTAVRVFTEVRNLAGTSRLQAVELIDHKTKATEWVTADSVIAALGFHSSLGPIKDWGLEFHGANIVTYEAGQTSRPGIYAAGDVAYYPGKVKLIATGFGEVGNAIGHIRGYLHPGHKGGLPHSTNLKMGE
ncbi:MAG: NAD(P)/FAD-dependent oxidoreductase [Firmicutes bacterium]|nr:NAD(P)/FAD-dependent oxidoreductase [Alicyclobacillaceae bacterium]MCL6497833.1 NAD(P)/FAD-dependent oxidoreductase [Bacillota bacterium]